MKKNPLMTFSVVILTIAAVGLVTSVALEIYSHEPVFMVVMKISAGLFGIGGPLLGWGIARRARRH